MKLQSHAIPSSNDYLENQKGHLSALKTISDAATLAAAGGGERAHDRTRVDGSDEVKLALQIIDYAQHWCLRVSMIALLAVFVGSFPSSGVASENHLACLHDANDDGEAFSVCLQKMDKHCFVAGADILDYPPQTACYKEYSNTVLEVAKDLQGMLVSNSTDFQVKFKAAALRYRNIAGEAYCDFLDETTPRDSDNKIEFNEMSKAMCYANAHSVGYWMAIVNRRIK